MLDCGYLANQLQHQIGTFQSKATERRLKRHSTLFGWDKFLTAMPFYKSLQE